MDWQPILTGELAERAWRAVHDIADELAKHTSPAPDLALFWTYLSAAVDDARTVERTNVAIDRFMDHVAANQRSLSLFGGLAGTGWVAAHLGGDVDDYLDLVDDRLLDTLAVDRWTDEYDLISGLVGFGVYFLERGTAPKAARGLARIVEHLAATSEQTAAGTTWLTRPELLPDHERAEWPNGYYNCGLAHGVPGVVALLARLAPTIPAAARLCSDAARWVVAQRGADGGIPRTTYGGNGPVARAAWCYGDPGVMLALWPAGVRGEPRWLQAPTPYSCLCHGAAGLAHMCNRLHQATRAPEYCDAALRWFEQALASYKDLPGSDPAGLLIGGSGIGLALLAGLTDHEPTWDRLLMCDVAR